MSWTILKSHFTFICTIFHENISDNNMSTVVREWVSPVLLDWNGTFIILKTTLSLILYPCYFRNIINHILYGMYLRIPTSSTSVELLTSIFYFNKFPWMIPHPLDMNPHVWLLVLLCTAYATSIHVNTSCKFLAPIICLYFIVLFTDTKPLLRFFQSYSSLLDSQVIKRYTNGSRYGHALFIVNNNLLVTE